MKVKGNIQKTRELSLVPIYQTKAVAGELFVNMERFMCTSQDGVVVTRAYKKLVIQEQVERDQYRMCGSALETLYSQLQVL